ncbi:MAG: ASKHA domain-containing protein [Lachnospiraceae bacterium]|nr:ASKHA domain-containing protein [Lachnospiraceae bacterium]
MPNVTFRYEDGAATTVAVTTGENLLEVARKANVAIDAPCSGNGSCGKCRVKYISGDLKTEQTRHISDEDFREGVRLACASTIEGDVEILVPDIASAYKSRMKVADLSSKEEVAIFEQAKQDVAEAGIPFENNFQVVELSMEEPTLDDTMPDNERLIRAIQAVTGAEKVKLTYQVLKKLADALRDNAFHVNAVLKKGAHGVLAYDVLPPDDDRLFGLAVDIGTTTVSAVILNLKDGSLVAKASSGNGQIRFGADVINRIIESRKPGGSAKLQRAIVEETINPMIHNMCHSAGIHGSHIYHMCIAGNSTMNHLLMGVNADPLRMEPYIPTFFETDNVDAYDLGLHVHPDARVIISPNIGSYVGGDITAGTLVSMIWNKPEFNLFIDLGTNGEIVFGNSDFMMSCACSAGPAFEGGDISCGMRATDGAIEDCTIDARTMEPTLTIVGDEGQKPVGLCGSGIIDVIAELFRCGIISPKGKFIREGERVRHDAYGVGSYVLAFKEDAAGHKDVEINEVDIDNFIRAKGAIFSAVCTMLRSLDFDVSMIENVYVAGGIGSGINMRNAVVIGMFPDIELDKFHYIGNSSLTGAYCMTLSEAAEEKVHELSHNMTYMELSTEPGYMDEFVAACFLPHTDTSLFPSVKQEEI